MDTLLHPVGDLDPGVYMRRRLMVLAFAVLAILVVYFLIKAAFASGDGAVSPNPSASPSVSPSPSVSSADVRACGTGDLTIDLSPMTRDFAGSEFPVFEATVTQTGLTACAVDTTLPGTELLITSGSDRIWSSTDCESGALAAQRMVLDPNETKALRFEWARIRSNAACGSGLPSPLPGTYHALLTLNGVTSQNAENRGVTFTLSD